MKQISSVGVAHRRGSRPASDSQPLREKVDGLTDELLRAADQTYGDSSRRAGLRAAPPLDADERASILLGFRLCT